MGVQGDFLNNRVWQDIFPRLVPQEEIDVADLARQARAPVRAERKVQPVQAEPIAPARSKGQLRATTLSVLNLHQHGELFVNLLRARRQVFIRAKGWELPEVDGMEFDQYDTPRARWIVLHEYGEVLGGVRLTPTTSQCGQYTYMIRDAQNGLLDSIPRDVLFFKAPVKDEIWEATRLFLSADVPSDRRMELQRLLLEKMSDTAREMGASHIIGMVPAVFSRWMTRLGLMSAVPVGPVQNFDGERTQAALMTVPQQTPRAIAG